MNRGQAIAAAVLLLLGRAWADDATPDDIANLPPCDRVEVIRIGIGAGDEIDGKWVIPADRTNLYHAAPHDQWWTISGRHTVKGPEAERLASFLRAFQPRISERIDPDGRRVLVGAPACHVPPFAYRFYARDKLLYDTSVCWGCSNLVVGPASKRRYFYFNTESKESKELLEASKKLFPEHPLK